MQRLLIFSLLVLFFSCGNENNPKSAIDHSETTIADTVRRFADLQYIDDFFDFGSIIQGEIVSTSFRFTNKGNSPLVIKHVIPGCGCTKVNVSKEVLKPNEEAVLEVTFESEGWRGLQYKSVTLRTNSQIAEKSVTIKANVIVK